VKSSPSGITSCLVRGTVLKVSTFTSDLGLSWSRWRRSYTYVSPYSY